MTLSRRHLLRRMPGALAALPFLPAVAALVPAAEPEAQPEAETVYGWWQVMISNGQLTFHDIPQPIVDDAGRVDWRGMIGEGISLAERNVLIRDKMGALVRWGLDTGWAGWPVSP